MAARTLMMAAILLLSLFCCSDAVAKHKSAKSGLRMVKHRHAKTGSHSNAARKHKAKKAFAQLEAKMNSHSEVEVEGLGDFIHGAFSFVNEVGKDLKRKLLFYAVKYLTGANSVKEYHKNLDIVKAAVYDAEDEEILGANDLKDAAEQAQQVGADALKALKRILTAETETVFGKKTGKDRDPVENPSILRSLFRSPYKGVIPNLAAFVMRIVKFLVHENLPDFQIVFLEKFVSFRKYYIKFTSSAVLKALVQPSKGDPTFSIGDVMMDKIEEAVEKQTDLVCSSLWKPKVKLPMAIMTGGMSLLAEKFIETVSKKMLSKIFGGKDVDLFPDEVEFEVDLPGMCSGWISKAIMDLTNEHLRLEDILSFNVASVDWAKAESAIVKGMKFLIRKVLMCEKLTEVAEVDKEDPKAKEADGKKPKDKEAEKEKKPIKKWKCEGIAANLFLKKWGVTKINLSEDKKKSIKELQKATMAKINHFRSEEVKEQCAADNAAAKANSEEQTCVQGLDQLAGMVATLLDTDVLLNFFDVTLVSTVTNILKRLIDEKDFFNDPNLRPVDCSGVCIDKDVSSDWPEEKDKTLIKPDDKEFTDAEKKAFETAKKAKETEFANKPPELKKECYKIHQQAACTTNPKCAWIDSFPSEQYNYVKNLDKKKTYATFMMHHTKYCPASTKAECIFKYTFTTGQAHPCEWINQGEGDDEEDDWICTMSENTCALKEEDCEEDSPGKFSHYDDGGCWMGPRQHPEQCVLKNTDAKGGGIYRKCVFDYKQWGCRPHPTRICKKTKPPTPPAPQQ